MLTSAFSMAVFARIMISVITSDIEQRQRREQALKEWHALLDGINKIADEIKKL